MININFKWTIIVTVIINIIIFTCLMVADASAQTTSGGSFNFSGSGDSLNVYASELDWASVDFTNPWGFGAVIHYVDVDDGEIFLRVDKGFDYDPMYYYDWTTKSFTGNGNWVVPINDQGGRNVTVVNSPNVTGWIEYPERAEKAVFQFDTRHREADLTVFVHNGELLENATVSLINGNPIVVWTDENGEAKFTPGTGNYHLIVEHENFSAMLVDDLRIDADKSYRIHVNMTDCLTSKGVAVCSPDVDDLIVYYKNKEPAMHAISPQGFVDHFADRLRTCYAEYDNCADGTLQWMADDWGVYPTDLNVLLYSCNFTDMGCPDGMRDWEITYVVKNYQQYECVYTVTLIAGNDTIELGDGELKPTWSTHAKETRTAYVALEGCERNDNMYLVVESERST